MNIPLSGMLHYHGPNFYKPAYHSVHGAADSPKAMSYIASQYAFKITDRIIVSCQLRKSPVCGDSVNK